MDEFLNRFEGFIGINFWTALFVLLNTIALFLVLKKYLFVPVLNMIAQRQKEIDDMYSEADAARSNAKAMESEYQEKLSVAAQTGERLVKEAVARGQSREEEILRQANAEANAIREKAAADIAMEKKMLQHQKQDYGIDQCKQRGKKVNVQKFSRSHQLGSFLSVLEKAN